MTEGIQKKILIVEDESALRKWLAREIAKAGFIVIEAEDGKEGLRVAKTEHPDLLLLDIIMPVMDGVALLRELRKDPWGKDARVIFLTNLLDPEHLMQATQSGVSDYLLKVDVTVSGMVQKVKDTLNVK